MAIYRPDYKLQEAKKLIDSLDNSKENELIRYYIKSKEDWIKTQGERIKDYQEVFDKMGRFLPNGIPTVYGG